MMRHQEDLLRFVLPLVGARLSDAEDVVQEAAIALWKKFDQYDPDRPFLTWAKRFVQYEALMHARRQNRYTFLTEELINSLSVRQDEIENDKQRRLAMLDQCLAKLPPEDLALVERRYAERSVTVGQVAEAMGATANVLYKNLARIRRALALCVARKLAVDVAN
jgi:RNA polymerase sigma-70 factor (ECF subfamily)